MNLLTPKWKLPKGASDFIDGAGKRFQTLPESEGEINRRVG